MNGVEIYGYVSMVVVLISCLVKYKKPKNLECYRMRVIRNIRIFD